MEKEIKFSLVYRDMFQSSGKFQPLAEQLEKVAPAIIEMGCFSRIETNGGAFEQVNLMAGENPNKAVRRFTKFFNEAGIQTHMLDRALNGLRMFPVPADVRKLMYKVKKAQGVDITRITKHNTFNKVCIGGRYDSAGNAMYNILTGSHRGVLQQPGR